MCCHRYASMHSRVSTIQSRTSTSKSPPPTSIHPRSDTRLLSFRPPLYLRPLSLIPIRKRRLWPPYHRGPSLRLPCHRIRCHLCPRSNRSHAHATQAPNHQRFSRSLHTRGYRRNPCRHHRCRPSQCRLLSHLRHRLRLRLPSLLIVEILPKPIQKIRKE